MTTLPDEMRLDVTAPFRDLILFSAEHGLQLIQKQGRLIPMVIALINGEHKITVLTAPSKAPDQMAKNYIVSLSERIDAYVVLLEGKVPVKGQYYDAVILMGGEGVRQYGYQLAQPYKRNLLRRIKPVGDLVYGGRTERFMR